MTTTYIAVEIERKRMKVGRTRKLSIANAVVREFPCNMLRFGPDGLAEVLKRGVEVSLSVLDLPRQHGLPDLKQARRLVGHDEICMEPPRGHVVVQNMPPDVERLNCHSYGKTAQRHTPQLTGGERGYAEVSQRRETRTRSVEWNNRNAVWDRSTSPTGLCQRVECPQTTLGIYATPRCDSLRHALLPVGGADADLKR